MKTMCRTCMEVFEVDDSYVGSTVYCPKCGGEVFVTNKIQRPKQSNRNAVVEKKSDSHEGLCFFLGMMFPVIGVVAGAIIGKERGFTYAILGHLTDGLIGGVIWILVYMFNR